MSKMLDYKKIISNLKLKIHSSKINYLIFLIICFILGWLILGVLGFLLVAVYFIFQTSFVRKIFPKLKNKKTASVAIVLAAIIVFGGIFGFSAFIQSLISSKRASFIPQPTAVTTTVVKKSDWQQEINTVGQAAAIQSTQISSQSGGIVTGINFDSGQDVKKGQLLFSLDTSQLKAELKAAIAQLKLSKITKDRYDKLASQDATSKQTADQYDADYLSKLANVQSIESQIGFKEVRAPFDGRIGIRNISLGQYFRSGDNAATLTKINPIYINFAVPQNKVKLIKVGQTVSFKSDSFPGETFKAKITAIDSYINSSNRSIMIQATYDNPDKKILPGMFVTVNVKLSVLKNVIVIPRNAVAYNLYGESVYVLKPVLDKDGKPVKASWSSAASGALKTVKSDKTLYKVDQDNIKVTETRNNLALVNGGLKDGDVIVTSGQNKVRKGITAIINNDVKFNNDLYSEGS